MLVAACTKYHFSVFPEAEKQHKGETEIQVKVRVLYLQEVFWGGNRLKRKTCICIFSCENKILGGEYLNES